MNRSLYREQGTITLYSKEMDTRKPLTVSQSNDLCIDMPWQLQYMEVAMQKCLLVSNTIDEVCDVMMLW